MSSKIHRQDNKKNLVYLKLCTAWEELDCPKVTCLWDLYGCRSIPTHKLDVLDLFIPGSLNFWFVFQRVGPYHTMNYIFVGTSEKGCLEVRKTLL